MVSIVATDTAIRGDVILSDHAVIMIRKERLDKLSEKKYGLDNYKNLVKLYNQSLVQLKK